MGAAAIAVRFVARSVTAGHPAALLHERQHHVDGRCGHVHHAPHFLHGGHQSVDFPDAGIAKSCYCMNGGVNFPGWHGGPGSIAAASNHTWPSAGNSDGITYWVSQTTVADVKDGTSNTYLIGEKYLNPDRYASWDGGGDAQSMFIGHDAEPARWVGEGAPLLRDRPGLSNYKSFGGPHPGGCQFVFCDGSVHSISFSIDRDTHRLLGNRKDRQPIDASEL